LTWQTCTRPRQPGRRRDDRAHNPGRRAQRSGRRLTTLACALDPPGGKALGAQLAVLIDGAYTSTAHLGPGGPAADGLRMARQLVNNTGATHE
jgi:hypothetical protein